jgi:DNA-binding NtrC family response regulator
MTGKSLCNADATAAASEVVSLTENQSAAYRVLVVDDEPLIRWAIAETLADLGYSVIEAGDGETALQALAEASIPIDVILLDYCLPDSDHLTLLSAIRRITPTSQVIMMTAFETRDLTTFALERGAYCVINKPFDLADVAAVIQHARPVRSR